MSKCHLQLSLLSLLLENQLSLEERERRHLAIAEVGRIACHCAAFCMCIIYHNQIPEIWGNKLVEM